MIPIPIVNHSVYHIDTVPALLLNPAKDENTVTTNTENSKKKKKKKMTIKRLDDVNNVCGLPYLEAFVSPADPFALCGAYIRASTTRLV